VLFRRGEASDCGYIVLSGSIALDTAGASSPDTIVRRDGLIGEVALITETVRPVTAIAREPSTVLKVPRTLFHRVLQEFPRSAARIRAGMSKRLAGFVQELEAFRRSEPENFRG
jgi:CRP-like cAMP-binding protein